VDRHRPRCFNLEEQLSAIGLGLTDIDAVVNCHLHATSLAAPATISQHRCTLPISVCPQL
jgi:hypothetical protein